MPLARAFKKAPARCALYSISIPHRNLRPQPNSAGKVQDLNKKHQKNKEGEEIYPAWNTAGARFEAVADINYGDVGDSPYTYEEAGTRFARLMPERGYNKWSMDEVPHQLLDKPNEKQWWDNLIHLVRGLHSGDAKGIVFNAYRRQSNKNAQTKAEKENLKTFYTKRSRFSNDDWKVLRSATRFWAEEAYTMCAKVCVGGASLGTRASRTNAYMQHQPRLAFASDAPESAGRARSLFGSRYLPLINAWAPVNNSHHTEGLNLTQIQQLISLQAYAARSWVKDANPYAGMRIGVRWTSSIDKKSDPEPRWTGDERNKLAAVVAHTIAGAYGQGGTARKACRGRTRNCLPVLDGASFTSVWGKFRYWDQPPTKPPDDPTPLPNSVAQIVADSGSGGYLAQPPNGSYLPDDPSRWRGYWQGQPAVFSDYQWQLCGFATGHSFGASDPLTDKVCSNVSAGNRPVVGISGQVEEAWRGYGAGNGPRAVFSALADEIPDGLSLGQASWDEESIIDPYPNGTFDRWYSRECHAAVGIESLEPAECGDYWFHEIDPNIPGWGHEVDESETTDGEPWHVVGGFYYDYNGLKPWLEVDFTATTGGGAEPVHQVAYSPGCSNVESVEFLTLSDGSLGVCEFEN